MMMQGHGPLRRIFRLAAYLNKGQRVKVITDASPFGMGAVLVIDGVPVAWFAIPIQQQDVEVLGVQPGDCKGQQCWESLCCLIAVRIWRTRWASERLLLTVRTDNVTALTMLAKLKASSESLRIIAREMALDFAMGVFEPDVTEHTPGVQNTIADVLSRRYDPQYQCSWSVPLALRGVPECHPGLRPRPWWLSLRPRA